MIGRERESRELERLYGSGRAELVAVYGRRRVGKTYLVDEMQNNYSGVFSNVVTLDDLFTQGLVLSQPSTPHGSTASACKKHEVGPAQEKASHSPVAVS